VTGYLIWDFDGTLATRPGNWTGALCEVVSSQHPELAITPDLLRPHLQHGFPWHTPETVRSPSSEDAWWEALLPVLDELSAGGWQHIVLSNHIPELPRLLAGLGLNDRFVAVYCSALTGAEKPHPRAFEVVFADYPEARNGWMIGDSWRADVQGAVAVGLRAVLVREKHAEATARCDTLHEVVRIVESR
jgi:putative hydrolase of the HAD superfamily